MTLKGKQMKTFEKFCAQGDVYIMRLDTLPANAIPVSANGPDVIVAHSETGHHHVMTKNTVQMYRLPDSIMDCLLVVKEPTPLRHLRPYNTHEDILFAPGVFRVRRQREYTPQGFRLLQD